MWFLLIAPAAAARATKVFDLIFLLLIGVIAGSLGGKATRGGGYGVVGGTVIGIIGALLGAWLFSPFGPWGGLVESAEEPFAGQIFAAFVGALILIAIMRCIRRV